MGRKNEGQQKRRQRRRQQIRAAKLRDRKREHALDLVEVFVWESLPGEVCPICEALGIHHPGPVLGKNRTPYSEDPGATNSGASFDQTPNATGSDLPWKS